MRNTDLKFTTAGDYMATRSRIGMRNANDTFTSVYVHWDGSPDTRMPILNEFYNTPEKIEELLSHGGISSLAGSIEETVFYHRDRGEELDIRTSETLQEFYYDAYAMSEEYVYLFDNGSWTVRD